MSTPPLAGPRAAVRVEHQAPEAPGQETAPPAAADLMEKIRAKTARVAIVGLGYVGLPLVKAIHASGFRVIGFDVDIKKIEMLRAGESYMKHLGEDFCHDLAASDRFTPTDDEAAIGEADIVLLCVPTPLGAHLEPDMRFVFGSTEMAGRRLRSGQLVVLESTTYPGTTREDMGRILSKAASDRGLDLEAGRDFFLAYSPEREDPGRPDMSTARIPKLVGGTDDPSGRLAYEFYRSFIESTHKVSSAEIAEAAKLLENIYRAVNIAMVNELKIIFDKMGIDVWEVIEAAKTKPFGFQAFYPGPGLGGHCIPIDPFYLTWKAKEVGHATRFIELAGEINQGMPRYVISKVMEALNTTGQALRGARVLVIGLAYKPNVDDVRESPAAEILELLHETGADVRYHDPHVPEFPEMRSYSFEMSSVALTEAELSSSDCVLIVTDHDNIDWRLIGEHAPLVVDTRNAMSQVEGPVRARVVKS